MKKKISLLLLLPALAACSGGYKSGSGDTKLIDDGYGVPEGGEVPTGVEEGEGEGGEGSEGNSEESQILPEPGQLTCSALDDNKEYEFWESLLSKYDENQEPGLFYEYYQKYAFKASNRIALEVKNGNDVKVMLDDQSYTAHVDNFNKAYLFPKDKKESYPATISYLNKNNERKTKKVDIHDGDVINLEEEKTLSNKLEIMFVIDTTGSMGDEIRYLISEIDDVVGKVKADNPTSEVTLAIMVYRDEGDDYITKYSEFTTDIAKQQNFLSKQSAGGGGDYEEAVQIAMDDAVNKKWQSEESTKLLFHVADAPAHDEHVKSWNQSVLKMAEKGIKIISVASSGINKKVEYFFRSQSLLTGGQYVFLTNDSGIGFEHLEATTKEKLVVEYLNECMIRLIDSYHQGKEIEPVPWRNNQQQ